MRIVSLLPSATEIVCALGAADELVGISHECDFPESIRGRPVLTRARIDAGASSRAIDAAVRAVVRDALSIYVVDDQRLQLLQQASALVGFERRGVADEMEQACVVIEPEEQ